METFEAVSKDILNETPMKFIIPSKLSDFPPSSLQSFLRESSPQEFHGSVITDHEHAFHNKLVDRNCFANNMLEYIINTGVDNERYLNRNMQFY